MPSRCIELRQLDRGREQREAGHVLCRAVRIAKFDRKTGKREDGKVLGIVRQERHQAQRRRPQRQHADRRKTEPRANLEHARHGRASASPPTDAVFRAGAVGWIARVAAGAFEFLTLIQVLDGRGLNGELTVEFFILGDAVL